MQTKSETLLIISGPVGVGKSTIGNEVSTVLESDGVPHTFVDLDALAYTFPRPASDRFGDALALTNLSDVWKNGKAAGSKNLIVARVCENAAYASKLAHAVGLSDPVLCRLVARDETLLNRVRARELGSNLDWHEKRSVELSAQMAENLFEDFLVETDARTVHDIAVEVTAQVDWQA